MSSTDPTPRTQEVQNAKRKALYRQLGFTVPDAMAEFVRGNDFFLSENYQEAVAKYTAALTIDPGFSEARFERARASRRLGRHTDAIADYRTLFTNRKGGVAIGLILVELVIDNHSTEGRDVLSAVFDNRLESRLPPEDRLFHMVYCAACCATRESFESVKKDFSAFANDLETTPIRPTWYTFTTLRRFLAAEGLTEEFRVWFRTKVEPIVDDKD